MLFVKCVSVRYLLSSKHNITKFTITVRYS